MSGSFEFLLGLLPAVRPCALEWTDAPPRAAYERAFLGN